MATVPNMSPTLHNSHTSETGDIKVSDDEMSHSEEEDEDFAPLNELGVPALPDLDTIHKSIRSRHKQRESSCLDLERTDSFAFGIGKRNRLSTMAGYHIVRIFPHDSTCHLLPNPPKLLLD